MVDSCVFLLQVNVIASCSQSVPYFLFNMSMLTTAVLWGSALESVERNTVKHVSVKVSFDIL
jgi:hypothetical protein